ncbi:MAG: hypothetical protein ACO3KD_05575 [Gaiellales bacterium]|jgi:hypothetical protein
MAEAEGARRRMRPAKVVLPVAIAALVLVFVGTRACSPDPEIGQDEAVAIATAEAGFPVVRHEVRFIRQGLDNDAGWVVGVEAADGRAKTFVIDAGDGAIERVEVGSTGD